METIFYPSKFRKNHITFFILLVFFIYSVLHGTSQKKMHCFEELTRFHTAWFLRQAAIQSHSGCHSIHFNAFTKHTKASSCVGAASSSVSLSPCCSSMRLSKMSSSGILDHLNDIEIIPPHHQDWIQSNRRCP